MRGTRVVFALAGLSIASPAWASNAMGTVDPAGSPAPAPVAPAEAAPPGEPAREPLAISLSWRVGWTIPNGNAFATASGPVRLASQFAGQLVPIHVDAGFLLRRRLVLGGYLEWSHVFVNGHGGGPAEQVCHSAGATSCSGASVRLGAQALVKLLADRVVEPWVGIGAGYEFLWYTADAKGEAVRSRKYGGWDLTAQAGLDLRIARYLRADLKIGPYGSVSLGQYGLDVERRATHQLVQLGLRGTLEARR